MNKKQLTAINKTLTDRRKELKLQNNPMQKNIAEQLELAMCKMLEYVKDQADLLKSYVGELRELKHEELSRVMLDALYDVIIKSKQDVAVIRRAYEDAKIQLKSEDNLEEIDLIIFHSAELNEIIRSLDRIEKVLLSYPTKKG
jgi:hypothetical protein